MANAGPWLALHFLGGRTINSTKRRRDDSGKRFVA
jgi:hypothetical protein